MDETSLVRALHEKAIAFVVAITGGGAPAIASLLQVPGASRSIVEVLVPYHEQALVDFLGTRPEQFCSAGTARSMARRARERAGCLAPSTPRAGVGSTASLVSDRPKRGDHRCFLCIETEDAFISLSLTLAKDRRDRRGEEAVVAALILNAMAEAAGIEVRIDLPLLPGETVVREVERKVDPLQALLRGDCAALAVFPDGRIGSNARPAALLPGAFNPMHAGHRQLAATAARRTGLDVGFELSALNVDKPPMSAEELRRRLHQFAWLAPVWITRAPTFVDKARVFPGTLFVVGADTAERVVSPRYYGDSPERMQAALRDIARQGCRFLVGGRRDELGAFRCLERVEVPADLQTLFEEIPEPEFRFDGSSTEIRARSG